MQVAKIPPFVYRSYDGPLQFRMVPGCRENIEVCNWCCGNFAICQISIRLSAQIWPKPDDDHFTHICKDCWDRRVDINPLLDTYPLISRHVTDDIANIIVDYLIEESE
jgi:hypothetical protein